jgi:hypothetical protein
MTSYLARLIDRATDGDLDLENNQIGNYRITPQHGALLNVYHIYKDNCREINSPSGRKVNNAHVATINIDFFSVDIELNTDYLTIKEMENIIDCINNLYSEHDINIKNM